MRKQLKLYLDDPECLRKLPAEGTITYTDHKTNLWKMEFGWTEKMREAAKVLYCTTCGARHDPRRKILKTLEEKKQ